MSKLHFVLACFIISVFAHAQQKGQAGANPLKKEFSIKWGSEFSAKNLASEVVGTVDGYVYVLKESRGGYGVDVVNSQMNVISTIPLRLEINGQKLILEGIYLFNGEIIVFGSRTERKEQRKYLYIQHFAAVESASDTKEYQLIAEIDIKGKTLSSRGSFDVLFSPDKSKIFVYCEIPGAKSDFEKFAVYVYDKNLMKVWSREVTLPYVSKDFTPSDTRVDNDGNVIVLGQLYKGKEAVKDRSIGSFNTRMLVYTADEEEADEYEINLPEINLKEMTVVIQKDKVSCIGFYSKGNSQIRSGAFVADIDIRTKEILDYNIQEFDRDFLTSNYSEKQKKKSKKDEAKGKDLGLNASYTVKQIFYDEAGNKFVIAEHEFVIQTTTTSTMNGVTTTTTTTSYGSMEIVVLKINPKNEIEWARKIPKAQITQNDLGVYNSYFVKQQPNGLLFIYNDNIKNLHVVKPGSPAVFSRSKKTSVAVAVTMDFDGNTGKTRLFSVSDAEIYARPKAFGSLEDGSIFMCTQKKKKQRYGILSPQD